MLAALCVRLMDGYIEPIIFRCSLLFLGAVSKKPMASAHLLRLSRRNMGGWFLDTWHEKSSLFEGAWRVVVVVAWLMKAVITSQIDISQLTSTNSARCATRGASSRRRVGCPQCTLTRRPTSSLCASAAVHRRWKSGKRKAGVGHWHQLLSKQTSDPFLFNIVAREAKPPPLPEVATGPTRATRRASKHVPWEFQCHSPIQVRTHDFVHVSFVEIHQMSRSKAVYYVYWFTQPLLCFFGAGANGSRSWPMSKRGALSITPQCSFHWWHQHFRPECDGIEHRSKWMY